MLGGQHCWSLLLIAITLYLVFKEHAVIFPGTIEMVHFNTSHLVAL